MKKRAISLFMCFVCLFSVCFCAPAAAFDDGLFLFEADKAGEVLTLLKCDEEAEGIIEIPEAYLDKPVTAIADGAFSGCALVTGIKLPDCVSCIGENAFGYLLNENSEYEKQSDFSVYGNTCTPAEKYAEDNGFKFIPEIETPVLRSVSLKKTGVIIQWQKAKNAEGYIIYRRAPGENWQRLKKVDGSTLSYIDETLTGGTKYKFTVKAYYKDLYSEYDKSGIDFFFIEPPKPISLENTADGVKFTWSNAQGAVKYKVYKKITGGKWQGIAAVSAASNSYTDTSAQSGVSTTYTVKALNGKNVSNYYSGLTVKYLAQPVLTGASNKDGAVTVKWQKVSDAEFCRVYRKTAGTAWQKLADVDAKKTSYTDKNVENGVKYTYTVKAFSGKYTSAFDKSGVKTVYLDTPKIKACTAETNGIKISWNKNEKASGYYLYRKAPGGSWSRIAEIKGGSTVSYTDKKAASGKTYYYTLKAIKSTYTSYYDTVGTKGAYIAAPTLKSVEAVSGGVKISWKYSGSASSFYLYRKPVGGSYERIATLDSGETTYTDKTAKGGKQYVYAMKAYQKGIGASAKSNELKLRLIDPSKPMVALTYDDGPYSPVTNRILDVLEKYGGRATFFVVGNRVNDYASSVKRAYSMGCEIGNHTYNHTILTSASAGTISSELEKTSNAVKNLTGQRPVIMRPPGGGFNSTVRANCDYPMIIWSVDTLDWKTRDSSSTIASVKRNVKDGSIILMHDLYGATATATESFVPWLVSQGYQLVTVSELMQAKGIKMQNGSAYYSAS